MIVNGALLLLLRSVSTALLAMARAEYVVYFYMSDMSMYFLYRILRRDLYHWVPLKGAASLAESAAERFIAKVLVDFTGVVHVRGAAEMGGCYFSFNTVRADGYKCTFSPINTAIARRSWRSPLRSSPRTSTTRASRRGIRRS
jgi:hypothetical protein